MAELGIKPDKTKKTLSFAEFDATVKSDRDVADVKAAIAAEADAGQGEHLVGTWKPSLGWSMHAPVGEDSSQLGATRIPVVSSAQSVAGGKTLLLDSFDPMIVEEVDELPSEPKITQEDVENARRAGIQSGIKQGIEAGEKRAREELEKVFAQAAKENDAAVDKMFHQLADQFEFLFEQQQLRLDQQAELMLQLTSTVWQRLMPEYVSAHGDAEIIAVVKDSLLRAREGAVITVRYAKGSAESLEKMLRPLQNIYADRCDLAFEADETLAVGDVVLSWRGGGADRRPEQLLQEVDSLVKRAIVQFHQQRVKENEAVKKEKDA